MLRNEFILLIPNNRHSSFLWHNLDRANPLTMRYGINNPGVQEFKDLFLNNFSHSVVKSPLWLPSRCAIRHDRDAMSTESGANALEVMK